jgi:hypothetical protein
MMRFDLAQFSSSPFPHGQGSGVFGPKTYAAMLRSWPSEAIFQEMKGPYRKLALSERCYRKHYAAFVGTHPVWHPFHDYIKTDDFRENVFGVFESRGLTFPTGTYYARFEFSSLPADGGRIEPHRDIPSKMLTIVVPMTAESVPGWGTDILEPLGSVGKDYETPRDAFRTVTSFDFAPNSFGLFAKTEDSWHAIGPLKGTEGQYRKTLTINIELVS